MDRRNMTEREASHYLAALMESEKTRYKTIRGTYRDSRDDTKVRSRHSRSAKTEKILKQKIEGYIERFTLHGLTRVFKAPRREATLWMVVLCLGIFLTAMVLYKLLSKYYKYETYTEIRSVVTDKNFFPSLSICELSLLTYQYFSYCGISLREASFNNDSKHCNHTTIPKLLDNVTMINDRWSNGNFEVTECTTWDSKNCNNKRFFKSHIDLNNSCFTWNYMGDATDIYGHVDIRFKVNKLFNGKEPVIFVTPHDPNIIEIDLTKMVNLDPRKSYEIKLTKTEVIRLPSPYPSNCTSEDDASILDILPGAYSRRTCVESYKILNAYKECGDTFDYGRPFIPEDIKSKYSKSDGITNTAKCMVKAVQKEPDKGACPFPCRELELGISATYTEKHRGSDNDLYYSVDLQFQNIDYYKIMEEKALYSANQLTCELGGFLGLVMGASLLSFVEILVCGFLYILKRIYKKKEEYDNHL